MTPLLDFAASDFPSKIRRVRSHYNVAGEDVKRSSSSQVAHLRAGALEPQELGEVVSGRVVDGVLEHLHLLHQGQVVVVWGHLKPQG